LDFELSQQHRRIRDTIDKFAERELRPNSAAWDRGSKFPREIFPKLGQLGCLGVHFQQEYGGGGADTLSQVLVIESLARWDASVALSCASHISLCGGHISTFANSAQKQEYLPPLVDGSKVGAWCLTEPSSGSDAAAMHSKAVKVKGGYSISGTKMFITNGSIADVYVVTAMSHPEYGRGGISAFIVERGAQGLSTGRKIDKLGLRASDTAEVIFENVVVPAGQMIGAEGEGYHQVLKILERGRIGIGGFAEGIARGAFEDSVANLRKRADPSAKLAPVHSIIADMATRIEASWLLICRAAALKDSGAPFGREASIAKLFASETAMWVTAKAVQIVGADGYLSDLPLERYMRDAKLGEIGEGTSEIQRMVIAKSLLRDGFLPL